MAKHPHRLMLVQNKTWRCTLPGCSWFVHRGLEYTLPGKQAQCWGCGENFTVDDEALRDEMPKCANCRTGAEEGGLSQQQQNEVINLSLAIKKSGANNISEVSQNKLNTWIAMGVVTKWAIEYMRNMTEDQVEVIEPDTEE